MVEVEGVEPSSGKVSVKVTTSVVYIFIFTRDKALDGANLKLVRVYFPICPTNESIKVSGIMTPALDPTGADLRGDAAVIY